MQNKILTIGLLSIALCGLFPPWLNVCSQPHKTTPAGHHFLLMPPKSDSDSYYISFEINPSDLFIEWICIGALMGATVLVFDKSKKDA